MVCFGEIIGFDLRNVKKVEGVRGVVVYVVEIYWIDVVGG